MQSYLEDIVPASQRKRVYAIIGLLGWAGGIVQTVIISLNGGAPLWLAIVANVLTYVGAGAAQVAQANTSVKTSDGSDVLVP